MRNGCYTHAAVSLLTASLLTPFTHMHSDDSHLSTNTLSFVFYCIACSCVKARQDTS